VRRVLEETPGVSLIELQWDEHWADVEFSGEGPDLEGLRRLLMPAGAWCDYWPKEE
jgi:hypothetical protein